MYPIYLQLKNRKCVVFGGGRVAERKVKTLHRYGASVTVISPDLTPELFRMWINAEIICHYRKYHSGDLRGYFLAISATNDPQVNREIYEEAKREKTLINVVDEPENCDFYVPAIVRRGDLQIAISTSGQSPAMAREIRKIMESLFDESYEEALKIVGNIRSHLKEEVDNPVERRRIMDTIVMPQVMASLQNGTIKQVKDKLREWI
ncbi:siroheme synthase [bacterium BMS3Abin05]|nr:siroheme synthase [bacterium BMS3Abin05]GBE28415.1 siroheme synthase [bacterium BMS3Bbin03]HDK35715.1 bifunctional precorrin-2 dehydrogenase/sirohydrochlorin ferrochelatase [Bacteroidota bacterium]HDL78245.1 bifunctional precorrin-2 dehydrogenase/sirohydrochlorin ferrochelatase [Bacteroidota bacterium]HDZ12313.1 bifunctional precorrin-2 dehydrogenase/sirohydrochlorin ferrochelatase [Bacteroidota bacterium]